MNSYLVVSKEPEVFWKIRATLGPVFTSARLGDAKAALDTLKEKRHGIVFIDLTVLKEAAGDDGYHLALRPFRQACPAVEVIVISSEEMIGEAVRAVKAGATDHLTTPIDPEEVKHVIQRVDKSAFLQPGLTS